MNYYIQGKIKRHVQLFEGSSFVCLFVYFSFQFPKVIAASRLPLQSWISREKAQRVRKRYLDLPTRPEKKKIRKQVISEPLTFTVHEI